MNSNNRHQRNYFAVVSEERDGTSDGDNCDGMKTDVDVDVEECDGKGQDVKKKKKNTRTRSMYFYLIVMQYNKLTMEMNNGNRCGTPSMLL